MIYKL